MSFAKAARMKPNRITCQSDLYRMIDSGAPTQSILRALPAGTDPEPVIKVIHEYKHRRENVAIGWDENRNDITWRQRAEMEREMMEAREQMLHERERMMRESESMMREMELEKLRALQEMERLKYSPEPATQVFSSADIEELKRMMMDDNRIEGKKPTQTHFDGEDFEI
jgi:hypothetical protein